MEAMPPSDMDWYEDLASRLLHGTTVHRGEWQSIDVSASRPHETYEIINAQVEMPIPVTLEALRKRTNPNLPWADVHFEERVGGIPVNPPPSHTIWPWARHNAQHQDKVEQFSHTYPERFWPKHAGDYWSKYHLTAWGLRFGYGDLNDVVTLLVERPMTRQAYLPVWFPEDTGAVHGKRVPCTLGYHFMVRNDALHCWYAMRSCDLVRHLPDDVYLAGRLVQWVCDKVNVRNHPDGEVAGLVPGTLHMTISSLHAFVGDTWKLEQIAKGQM